MSPLLAAFGIGVAFGAVLERAGLGDARKLTAQFRLTDLTVFKVMFTAIVTAMLGLVWLERLGVVDTARLAISPTWLLPQAVGGLVFGVGFVAGGYCPGTSCVAAAAGRLDALATLGGIALGTLLFGAALPLLEPLYRATPLGTVTLPEVFGFARGTVVLAVVVAALAAFAAAGRIERRAERR